MNRDQREIQRKLRILLHAEETAHGAKTCRYFGIGRSSFYRWRQAYVERGEAGLINVDECQIDPIRLSFTTPFAIKRRSNETKIILGDLKSSPDANLLNALKDARFWLDELRAGKNLAQIANDSETGLDFIRKRIGLGLVSPTIQKAILSGDHPNHWSVSLFTISIMPMDWKKQGDLFAA